MSANETRESCMHALRIRFADAWCLDNERQRGRSPALRELAKQSRRSESDECRQAAAGRRRLSLRLEHWLSCCLSDTPTVDGRRRWRRGAHSSSVKLPFSAARLLIALLPSNLYAAAPDFVALAAEHDDLRPYVTRGRGHIDFRDYSATRQLTRALLRSGYGLSDWWVPDGHLLPTVTNRANYIHFVEDLLSSTGDWAAHGTPPRGPAIVGLDIGVGCSCVYPLLGASIAGWRFVGTDVTAEALSWAAWNAAASPHLTHLIDVIDARPQVESGNAATAPLGTLPIGPNLDPAPPLPGPVPPPVDLPPLLSRALAHRPDAPYAFVMCNPPFFGDAAEAGRNPGTDCGGTDVEMVTPGGEAEFVARLVAESSVVSVRPRVAWFTTMVGKKATLGSAKMALRATGATSIRVGELAQGRTSRWVLAWSYAPVATGPLPVGPPPPSSKLSFTLASGASPQAAVAVFESIVASLRSTGADCAVDRGAFAVVATAPGSGAEPTGGVEGPPAAKRPRRVPEGPTLRATVMQQAPGSLAVSARLVGTANHGAAAWFAATAAGIQDSARASVAALNESRISRD